MRIDSDPRNLVTGGDRFPVDLSLPQVPPDESELDFSTDAVVPRNAFAPFLDPFSFVRGDVLEPRLRPEELSALVFASTSPDPTPYRHARDGIELPRRARLLRI